MKRKQLITFIVIAAIGLFACNKSDDSASSTGKLSIKLTDAPFPTDLVAEANVTISKIEIRKSDDSEGNPFTVLSTEEMKFNLLDLTNGVTASLVNLDIEPGSYDLIRLYVTEASLKLKDGSEHKIKVPSGEQTGIKIFIDPSIKVAGGLTSELLLDFVVSKSFVLQGNIDSPAGIKGFIFKPVIKAANLSISGRLLGSVSDTSNVAIEGAQVSIIAADTVYTTSFTDENGDYAILGIDGGTYNVRYEREGYEMSTIENIEIVAGNATDKDVQLTEETTTEETVTE